MSVQISRILHAGYLFQSEQTTIVFDPLFENPFSFNCHAFPDVKFDLPKIRELQFSAVFISHYHEDHCSLESLDLLPRTTPIFLYCLFDELFEWIRELGFTSVHALELGKKESVGPFQILPLLALDSDVDCVFQIEVDQLKILNVVDSWIDPQTMDRLQIQAPWDLVLWPFQTLREIEVLSPSRYQNHNPEIPHEWLEQLKQLKPRYVVPSSCQFIQAPGSWLNHFLYPISYQLFQQTVEAELPTTKIFRLNPGVSVHLDPQSLQAAPSLTWVEPLGAQDVDYDYRKNQRPTSLEELTKNFEALTPAEQDVVEDYCQSKLMERYRSLDVSVDSFFSESRIWRLTVIASLGRRLTFEYRIHGKKIERLEQNSQKFQWCTEILQCKLFSALQFGESLSSLEIRINDQVLDPESERDLVEVDVLADPLVRCLYDGKFGEYQKAQLQKLRLKSNPERE